MEKTFKFTRKILNETNEDRYAKFIARLAYRGYEFSVKRAESKDNAYDDYEMYVTVKDITISDRYDAIEEFGAEKA